MRTLRRRWQPIVRSDRPFRHPATLYLDRRGVVALVTALLLPVLLGAIGLGVEASAWTYQTVQLQRAADLAALLADPNSYFYVCGLKSMEEGVVMALRDIAQGAGLHWDGIGEALRREGRLHLETY